MSPGQAETATGGHIQEIPLTVPGAKPTAIAVGTDGNIWFGLENLPASPAPTQCAIGRLNPLTHGISVFPYPDPKGTQSLAQAQDGHVWIAGLSGVVHRFDPRSASFAPIPVPDGGLLTALAFGPDGSVWCAANGTGLLHRIDRATLSVRSWLVPSGGKPQALAFGSDGALWYTLSSANRFGRLDLETGGFQSWDLPFANPAARIASGPSGLWVSSTAGHWIGDIDPATAGMTRIGLASGSAPVGVAVGGDGALWYCASGTNRVGRIDAEGGQPAEWTLPTANSGPYAVAIRSGGEVWCSGANSKSLVRLTTGTTPSRNSPQKS
ncbi:hypothetical protein [Streptomyces sp. UNOC14_S4]|uniref:Vgb family protein n=1 Tax=Streptomyces sp. UNOC14_S4 TaxID=2872340 RepID=UPI001E5FFCFA|nr:hypothetical protein [Streptomyces sp. UNOC14_S4]MCC3772084.1 hypothetical protein [Streptomyces sp. UNOC14_S4]